MRGDYWSRGEDKNSVRGNVGISGDGRSFSVERSRKEEDLGDGIEVKGRWVEESGHWKRRLVRVLTRPELRMRLGHSESVGLTGIDHLLIHHISASAHFFELGVFGLL